MANTTNLDLVKPLGTDHALVAQINSNSDKIDAEAGRTRANFAAEYSASSAYAVGAFCTHNGILYQCNTAIGSGGEAWTSGHWTQISAGDAIVANSQAIASQSLYPANVLTSANNMNSVDVGTYYQDGNSMPANAPPNCNNAFISVTKGRPQDRFQFWVSKNSGTVLYRMTNAWSNGSSSSWTDWKELALNTRTLLLDGSPTASTGYDLNDSALNYDYIEIIFTKSGTSGAFVSRIINHDNLAVGSYDAFSFSAYNNSSYNFYAEAGFIQNNKFNIATYRVTGWTIGKVYVVGIGKRT